MILSFGLTSRYNTFNIPSIMKQVKYKFVSYKPQAAYILKREPTELRAPWEFFWVVGKIKTVITSLEILKREKQDAHLTAFKLQYTRHLKISSRNLCASHFEGTLFNYKNKKDQIIETGEKKRKKTNLAGGYTFSSMKLGQHWMRTFSSSKKILHVKAGSLWDLISRPVLTYRSQKLKWITAPRVQIKLCSWEKWLCFEVCSDSVMISCVFWS